MAISLKKGGNVSLSRNAPNLAHILVGLGWDARETAGDDFDLDASIFMVQENGKVRADDDFVFYNQLVSRCRSVEHTGDSRSGAGDGDDEALKVNLPQVPSQVHRLVVCVTIHDAEGRKQNFGMVRNAFMRIVNSDNDAEIARFDLSEDYSTETAMIFGEIYRHSGEWKFRAVGQGFTGGLDAMCRTFGVSLN